MGSTNKTTNYELSQYIGTDKPSWLNDYNNDMLKIDTQMKANATAAGNAQTTATSADGKADTNTQAISTLNTQINEPSTGLAAVVSGHTTDISGINGKIGDTPLTTTAQTLTGAINELDSTKASLTDITAILKYNGNKVFTSSHDGAKTYATLLNELFQQLITYLSTKSASYRFRFLTLTPRAGFKPKFPVFIGIGNSLLNSAYDSGIFAVEPLIDSIDQIYLASSGSYWKHTAYDPNNIVDESSNIADGDIELTIEEYVY